MAICTSPGFCALPEGMFSLAQTMPMTRRLGLSCAMARMAPIMAAPPAMSYFIFSMPSAGLDGDAAAVEGDALADQSEHALLRRFLRLVAHDDQPRLFVRTLGHAPECAHLQLFDLVRRRRSRRPVRSLRTSGLGAVGEDGGRHAIAGFVDQVAGKVLRLADDAALLDARSQAIAGSRPSAETMTSSSIF